MKFAHLAIFSLLLCLPLTGIAGGRKAKLIEGSLDALQGVKKVNVKFSYEGMTVGKREVPAEEYVANRKEELNNKESGKGTTWARSWEGDRSRRFEPGFKDNFNKVSPGFRIGAFPEEKYTMIFKTTNMEPGYNVGVSRKNALVSGEAWIVETANPSNVICKIAVRDCPGNMGGFDFDNGERIKMSYVVAGNAIGKLVKKKL